MYMYMPIPVCVLRKLFCEQIISRALQHRSHQATEASTRPDIPAATHIRFSDSEHESWTLLDMLYPHHELSRVCSYIIHVHASFQPFLMYMYNYGCPRMTNHLSWTHLLPHNWTSKHCLSVYLSLNTRLMQRQTEQNHLVVNKWAGSMFACSRRALQCTIRSALLQFICRRQSVSPTELATPSEQLGGLANEIEGGDSKLANDQCNVVSSICL